MLRIKKNDNVLILTGKDKGKTGKVLRVVLASGRALVQGINFVKKHQKKRSQDEEGGIIQREASIDLSNLAVICKGCNSKTRVGMDILKDGSKVRYCKNCKEVL